MIQNNFHLDNSFFQFFNLFLIFLFFLLISSFRFEMASGSMTGPLITRSAKIICPILGQQKPFDKKRLPTSADVLLHYQHIRFELRNQRHTQKEPSVHNEILPTLRSDIKEIWDIATIPVISDERVLFKLRKLHEEYNLLLKQPKARMESQAYLRRLSTFKADCATLFDIAACKCNARCQCDPARKVSYKYGQAK